VPDAKTLLFLALGAVGAVFTAAWIRSARRKREPAQPGPTSLAIGFITNFFDTLGIGSFAPTTSIWKLKGIVPDEKIPGTLNVGHAGPTIVQAFIFIAIVRVEMTTLVALILASVLGAWLGAGIVASWPRRRVQLGMGAALFAAACFFAMANLGIAPVGGTALGLTSPWLWVGIAGNFALGALMTLGIGLYAPCMILIALLGMNPRAAFPIMMGSCAFLMPVGGLRFIAKDSYSLRAAVGLTIGGIPAVLLAAFVVKSLPLTVLRWVVVAVVLCTAVAMLRSAMRGATAAAPSPAPVID
jgi:uncharacterized membrane protein YfcA